MSHKASAMIEQVIPALAIPRPFNRPWGAHFFNAATPRQSPTIAVTKAHIHMPEFSDAIKAGRLKPDGKILSEAGDVSVTKAAIDPVWYLPGMAARFGIEEAELRRTSVLNRHSEAALGLLSTIGRKDEP